MISVRNKPVKRKKPAKPTILVGFEPARIGCSRRIKERHTRLQLPLLVEGDGQIVVRRIIPRCCLKHAAVKPNGSGQVTPRMAVCGTPQGA